MTRRMTKPKKVTERRKGRSASKTIVLRKDYLQDGANGDVEKGLSAYMGGAKKDNLRVVRDRAEIER